jgi:hypothetical protein
MARKTVVVSDLSGETIQDGKGAKVRITFDDARSGAIKMDVTADEAKRMGKLAERRHLIPHGVDRRLLFPAGNYPDSKDRESKGDYNGYKARHRALTVTSRHPSATAPVPLTAPYRRASFKNPHRSSKVKV